MNNRALLEAVARVGLTEDLQSASATSSQLYHLVFACFGKLEELEKQIPADFRDGHIGVALILSLLKKLEHEVEDLERTIEMELNPMIDDDEEPYGRDEDEPE